MSYNKLKVWGYTANIQGFDLVVDPVNGTSFSPRNQVQSVSRSIGFFGTSNPFWKSQIRNHVSATTNANGDDITSHVDYLFAQGQMTYIGNDPHRGETSKSVVYGYPVYDVYPSTASVPDSSKVTEVNNRAIRKFLQACHDAQGRIEAGQDLGELTQTIESIVNPLGSLRRHVLSYFTSVSKLRRKYKRFRDAKKAIADTYLEWTFGWNPLVADITDAYNALHKVVMTDAQVVSASASIDHTGSDQSWSPPSGSALTASGHLVVYSKYSIRYKGAVRNNNVNGFLPQSQIFGFLPSDFLPTLWELLPYSFVADYFINIGDVIDALCFRTSDLGWCVKTIRALTRYTYSVREYKLALTPSWRSDFLTYSGGNAVFQAKSFTRNGIDPRELVPQLQFHLPLSAKPWENISALLVSQHKKIVNHWPF